MVFFRKKIRVIIEEKMSLKKPVMELDADTKKTCGNREKILATSPLFTGWDSTIMFIPLFIKSNTKESGSEYVQYDVSAH